MAKRARVHWYRMFPMVVVILIALGITGVGIMNGYLVFSARTSSAAVVQKTPPSRAIKYKSTRSRQPRGAQKFWNVIMRPFRKPTAAEQFAAIEQELTEAAAKGRYLSPRHSDRVFADLKKLEQQGYPKNEIERLYTLAYSLSSHLKDQARQLQLEEQKKQDDPFNALIQELAEAKKNGTYLSPEHLVRVFADIAVLERMGYEKSETDRLRALAMELSPHLTDQERLAAGETGGGQGQLGGENSQSGCVSNPNPVFTADITDLSRISAVTPPGMLMQGDVLKSHSYIWIGGDGKVPVYAPVDASLVAGVYLDHPDGNLDYGLIFQVSCEVEFRLGHITDPNEQIRAAFPTPKVGDSRDDPITHIPFKAGDLLGYTSGTRQAHNWDFGVYNTARPDPDAAAFGATGKDARANCPYDYYSADKRSVYSNLFNSDMKGGVPRVAYCD